MSDGPHRSLPMRRGWKRVAERGDKRAFASDEVSDAIIIALEQDCHREMPAPFLDAAWRIFSDPEPSLFAVQISPQLETLRQLAGPGIGRLVLEQAILVAERGKTGMAGLVEAMTNALTDRAAKGARQVEEHYCRESTTPRAKRVRARIEEGISGAVVDRLARRILKVEQTHGLRPTMRQGLDDGVKF
jgi:hypothetical protein